MHSPNELRTPVILVVDSSPIVPKVIRLALKRYAELSVQTVAFPDPLLALRWLTGAIDWQKAERVPLATPWDQYPPLAQTSVGLALLSSEFPPIEDLQLIDWIASLLPRGTPIVTLSSEPSPPRRRYRTPLAAHLQKPLETQEIVARLSTVLVSEFPTRAVPAFPQKLSHVLHCRR
jgi:CheY-like chemotaxis protein